MKDFLKLVADSLRSKFDNKEMSRTIVIFPNKRASLFLNNYLLKEGETMLWAPTYMSISEFFLSLTKQLHLADPIETICRLYKIFVQEIPESKETLDHFYGWGERLLADFDDLDKNLGDAAKIFQDMKEYEEIGMDDVLDEEQVGELKKFARIFSEKYDEKNKGVRYNFRRVWDKLLSIYTQLRSGLENDGLAYEGQLHRMVVEGLEDGSIALPDHYKHIAFVGFNVLNNAEEKLFKQLKEKGLALFYWDYDLHYIGKELGAPIEAGTFLKENLVNFPNELNRADFNNLTNRCEGEELQITYAQASTNSVQAAYVKQWLLNTKEKHINLDCAQRTAIVLCDETMLQPTLYALPSQKEMKKAHGNDENYHVNITNGFPLSHTPAFTFVVKEMEAKLNELDEKKVKGEKVDTYTLSVNEARDYVDTLRKKVQTEALLIHKTQGKDVQDEEEKQDAQEEVSLHEILYTEAYFRVYSVLTRFSTMIEKGVFAEAHNAIMRIGYAMLFKLIRQVLRGMSIPFHGEPAIGLQVMGVLETRCLDFDNILMLSVGEGILPQKASEASFIPSLIRQKYKLTTYVRKNAVYAYYFFRLLQRAKHVTLAYNNSTAGTQHGEMSRFMRNMLIDPKLSDCIKRIELESAPQQYSEKPTMSVDKPFEGCYFSPTSLNEYLSCKRKFYYNHVLKLVVPDEENKLIDQRDLGNLVHKMAELFYAEQKKKKPNWISSDDLKAIVEDASFDKLCAVLLEKAYVEVEKDEAEKAGKKTVVPIRTKRHEMLDNSVLEYFKLLLKYEAGAKKNAAAAPSEGFNYLKSEKKCSLVLDVPTDNDGTKKITLGGSIDRLDEAMIDGKKCLRVIDYKTGRRQKDVKKWEYLFAPNLKDRDGYEYAFQAMLYSFILYKNGNKDLPIVPALFYIPLTANRTFSPYILYGERNKKEFIMDFRPYADEFENDLKNLLSEIISPSNQFETNKLTDCKYCNFKQLCEDAKESNF